MTGHSGRLVAGSFCGLGAQAGRMIPSRTSPLLGFLAVALLIGLGSLTTLEAQSAPAMGTAQKFAVLGSSTVTNTGATILTGNLGVSPGSAITGFPPGVVTGSRNAADGIAAQARLDAFAAFGALGAEPCTQNLSGTGLGGLTLLPGVYCFDSSAALTGTLTLDASTNPTGVFIFKIGSTFTTDSSAAVVIIGGSACNVFFRVGSSATVGTGTQILGTIFAGVSITLTTGATVTGGAYALTGAVTLDGNSVTACMGTIQVCKVAGSGVIAGTDFVFDVGGTPVTVPAGPAPGGSCSLSLEVPSRPIVISETLPPGTTLAAVSTQPSPGSLISSNLALGTATVAVSPGGQTTATFLNTVPPIIPTTGRLQICKVAGGGVIPGAVFAFDVTGNFPGQAIQVAAGLAPGGTCSAPIDVPSGLALITETLPLNTLLTAVSTLPDAGLLVSSNVIAGTATVTVNGGGQTIVTFTNTFTPVTGRLQICKVAGPGVLPGANFTFTVPGIVNPVIVAAGPAPAGSCSPAIEVGPGPKDIAETLPLLTSLISVVSSPGGSLVSSNLPAGTATVTVVAGFTTVVTFQNTMVPAPTKQFLQICKVAGSGVTVGTFYSFNAGGTPISVPAGPAPGGTCSIPTEVQAGLIVITETLPGGVALTSVNSTPVGSLVSTDLPVGKATVTVSVGGQTIVTFVNTLIPIIPATGLLQICKVAGSGIPVGTLFAFSVGGAPVSVAAGPAPGGTCSSPLPVPVGPSIVTETVPSGTALTTVSSLPIGSLVSSNLASGAATVTVTDGGQTTVTFLNALIPVIPTTGRLQICKVAGSGVGVGTPYTFTVAGLSNVTVLAGAAPGGNCSQALVVPGGATLVTETLAGSVLTDVSTVPAGMVVSSNLSAGTASIMVNAGGQTVATFLNTAIPTGMLQICKAAGAGVTLGTDFKFSVSGSSTLVTVPAGLAPVGTCSQPVVSQIGQRVVTESLPAGTTLVSVSTTPANLLVSSNLPGGSATVTVNAGATTVVTFLNTTAPTTGLLQICKIAGTGVAPGEKFNFLVAGTNLTVPAGSCATGGSFPNGTSVTIAETPSAGTVLSAIGVSPADRQLSASLPSRTVTVKIGADTTVVSFTNTAGGVGMLKVCKIAGTGIVSGTRFTFTVAGASLAVPAGFCAKAGIMPVGTVVTITEPASPGTSVSAIGVVPADRQNSVNLPGRTVTATVGVGVTEVYFTNVKTP